MDAKVAELLKAQVNKEFYSAYLYLAFSNYYIDVKLDGFGHWFEVQAKEEVQHALMFLKYLQDNDETLKLEAIAAPDADFSNFRQPLEASLNHEKYVTGEINKIYSQAKEVNDFRCCQFLEWFIKEQGQEEKTAADLLGKFDLFGTEAKGLYMLNAELAQRPDTTINPSAADSAN